MSIVALKNETFDNFLLKSHETQQITNQKAVESYDKRDLLLIHKVISLS